MRILKFLVDGQSLSADPDCDFSGLVPGTKGYIFASFKFSEDWNGCKKVAQFSSGNIEYTPQVIDGASRCPIPVEALERSIFNIRLYGAKGIDYTITTNKYSVRQKEN